MRITQTIAVIGLFASAITAACSDGGPLQPEALKKTLAAGSTAGGTDTAGHTPTDTSHHTPPDSGSHTGPDTAVGHPQQNLDPRNVIGTVNGLGAQPDTTKYELVAGATVVLSTPDDSTTGIPGKELARAVSKTDGSFTLGSFKPGVYQVAITPAAGSPFGAKRWAFQISPYSPATFTLGIWLNRK